MTTESKTVPTYWVRLCMAGDYREAKQVIRRFCYPPEEGLCVTVRRQTYIYNGGEERGFEVGLCNYPRFPKTQEQIWERARTLAERLIPALCQWSALLIDPERTEWITTRPEYRAECANAQPNA